MTTLAGEQVVQMLGREYDLSEVINRLLKDGETGDCDSVIVEVTGCSTWMPGDGDTWISTAPVRWYEHDKPNFRCEVERFWKEKDAAGKWHKFVEVSVMDTGESR